jgi:hypothetical protein
MMSFRKSLEGLKTHPNGHHFTSVKKRFPETLVVCDEVRRNGASLSGDSSLLTKKPREQTGSKALYCRFRSLTDLPGRCNPMVARASESIPAASVNF